MNKQLYLRKLIREETRNVLNEVEKTKSLWMLHGADDMEGYSSHVWNAIWVDSSINDEQTVMDLFNKKDGTTSSINGYCRPIKIRKNKIAYVIKEYQKQLTQLETELLNTKKALKVLQNKQNTKWDFGDAPVNGYDVRVERSTNK